MPLFLRKSSIKREPLALTMSGVRMGERVLQIGFDDASLAGTIAAKSGMSGQAAIVVADARAAEHARAAAAERGVLIDVQMTALQTLPFTDAAFDVVVVHAGGGLLASMDEATRSMALREQHRVLRQGGRLIVIERGTPAGLARLLGRATQADPAYEAAGGTVRAAEAAGFKPVRVLADREGSRFIEGLKT